MKAPDIVESWKWRPAEEIIERLLSLSSRTIGLPLETTRPARRSDHYARQYTAMRRLKIRLAMKRAIRGGR